MDGVVVTGVSSGIGRGILKVLVERGCRVFGSVRQQSDARRLESAFGRHFTPLLFDVTDEVAVREAADTVRDALGGRTLKGLVSNAGIAVPGPVLHQPLTDFRRQIETNLIGAVNVVQAFAPLLGADRAIAGPPGRIVTVSSLGGKIAAPLLGAYCASKHALEGLSACLRRELMPYGIDVVVVGPGAVKTPIWEKATAQDLGRYAQTDCGPAMARLSDYMAHGASHGLDVERVGALVHHALTTRRPRVRYALAPDLVNDWLLPRMLPARWVDRLFASRLGLERVL